MTALQILSDWIMIAKDKGNTGAVKDLLLLQDIIIDKLEYIGNESTIIKAGEILSSMAERARGESVEKIKIINESVRSVLDMYRNVE